MDEIKDVDVTEQPGEPVEPRVPHDAPEDWSPPQDDGERSEDDPGPVTSTHEGPAGAVAAEAFPAPEDDSDAPTEDE